MAEIRSAFSTLSLMAATPAAGVALVNGTPTILTWNVPNDGNLHRAAIFFMLNVTVAETGGALQLAVFDGLLAGSAFATLNGGGSGAGLVLASGAIPLATVHGNSNSTVKINQTSALTVGAATVYAEIWGA